METAKDVANRYESGLYFGKIHIAIEAKAAKNLVACIDRTLFNTYSEEGSKKTVNRYLDEILIEDAAKARLERHIKNGLGFWNDSFFAPIFDGSEYSERDVSRFLWILRQIFPSISDTMNFSVDFYSESFQKELAETLAMVDELIMIEQSGCLRVEGASDLYRSRNMVAHIQIIDDTKTFIEAIKLNSIRRRFWRGESSVNFSFKSRIHRGTEQTMECDAFYDVSRRLSGKMLGKNYFEKLAELQHYGFPTRLIDVTENPLVALFFACIGETNSNYSKVVELSPPDRSVRRDNDYQVRANSCIVPLAESFARLGGEKLEVQQATLFDLYSQEGLPHSIHHTLMSDMRESIIVLANHLNPRLIAQSGAFILVGDAIEKLNPSQNHQEWISRMICIPSHARQKILRELSTLGISFKTMFPDIQGYGAAISNSNYEIARHPIEQ